VAAGPLFIVLSLYQMSIREGFDIRRHTLSLLENGDLGWIQVANFMITGLLLIVDAVGLRRVLRGSRGGTWGPLLLGLYGLGWVGAAIFTADPMNGFPPGTPIGNPVTISTHSLMHFVTAGIGFLGFISACFVFARRFAGLKQTGWMMYSIVAGVLFLVAFVGIASGSQAPWASPAFATAASIGFIWISALSLRVKKELNGQIENPVSDT
ncbi:MAG: DUF998 domain-containing protein, partial [bacterium]